MTLYPPNSLCRGVAVWGILIISFNRFSFLPPPSSSSSSGGTCAFEAATWASHAKVTGTASWAGYIPAGSTRPKETSWACRLLRWRIWEVEFPLRSTTGDSMVALFHSGACLFLCADVLRMLSWRVLFEQKIYIWYVCLVCVHSSSSVTWFIRFHLYCTEMGLFCHFNCERILFLVQKHYIFDLSLLSFNLNPQITESSVPKPSEPPCFLLPT